MSNATRVIIEALAFILMTVNCYIWRKRYIDVRKQRDALLTKYQGLSRRLEKVIEERMQ